MKKAYITVKEKEIFDLIPEKACNLCHQFTSNISKDEQGLFIRDNAFTTRYMMQHISEILHRQLVFE